MAEKNKTKKRRWQKMKRGMRREGGGKKEEKVGAGHGRLKRAGKSETQIGNINWSPLGEMENTEQLRKKKN